LHHVHANTAAGNFRDYLCGTESGTENKFERLSVTHAGRFLQSNQSLFNGLGANLLRINAAPIVADLDYNLITLMKRV
jgi:hypothetical protein